MTKAIKFKFEVFSSKTKTCLEQQSVSYYRIIEAACVCIVLLRIQLLCFF